MDTKFSIKAAVFIIIFGIIAALALFTATRSNSLLKNIETITENQNNPVNCSSNDDCFHNGSCDYGNCKCTENYFGISCNKTCAEFSQSISNSSVCCGEHGDPYNERCICHHGWSGQFCDIEHVCPQNITVLNCERQSDCLHDGLCWYGRCICSNPNYWGDNCEFVRRDLSVCVTDAQCNNNGVCILNVNGANGKCFCLSSTTTIDCQ